MFSDFRDRELVCVDCEEEFTFTAQEQERYSARSFSEPKRCPRCRAARRRQRKQRTPRRRTTTTTTIICDSCGKESEVPFKPKGDRPVYCAECYRAQKRDTQD